MARKKAFDTSFSFGALEGSTAGKPSFGGGKSRKKKSRSGRSGRKGRWSQYGS